MALDFTPFVRKPFTIEAVEITEDNIAEIAPKIGELCTKEDGTPFIKVDSYRVPNVPMVFPGYWMTKMGNNIRCYSRKVFRAQFTESTEEIDNWVKYMNNIKGPEGAPAVANP